MIRIRIVNNVFILTSNTKPKNGDWMCCFAEGIEDRRNKGKYIGRRYFLVYHDDKPVNKLNAICEGTEKVLIKIGKLKK